MSRHALCTLAVFAALLAGGCKNVVEGAKDEFSKEFTCPLDRVEARARPELHRSDLESQPTPPKDIAADPARLKMWQEQQAKVNAARDSQDDIVELRGCGHQVLYACHRFKNGNTFMCNTRKYPGGVTPAW
jgi:hypothetical protein